MKKAFLFISVLLSYALQAQELVSEKKLQDGFPLVSSSPASIITDEQDDWLVSKAASLFQSDVEAVSGKRPNIIHVLSNQKFIIITGTVDHSSFIKKLIAEKKIDVSQLKGKWDSYLIQTITHPITGVEQALVICGSDKRGTAYGLFELSREMGVSPWYWWADVPVKKKAILYVKKGIHQSGPPSVQYRGIFINDEAPAFSGWTKEKFGGVNHLVYEKMFELLLRLKANYLWPAMWGNAFNDDDTLNPVLANKWGIVMGTSHHEPMLRAQQEWKRYGHGPWDYDSNATVLREFWRKGIEHMDHHESIVTIGMRGDGDKPMTEGTAINLLENIVSDQRKIIEDVTGKPASLTPQLWALYKEVQDYYDKGMRVPDDVTLLLCDDNWGNIRRLPKPTDPKRSGGYGIYYHFDYVGGPRNYKWINTNNIARVWEQMHLAYASGVNKIWIVNVGDLKPMEFPISFFLDYAWNTSEWNEDNLSQYFTQWSAEQFGPAHAKEIGDIIQKYSQYNARRKPELLDATTYSLTNYNEAERVLAEWKDLEQRAQKINTLLPSEYKDAFFELVLHPVLASANLNELYVAVARNHWYASQNNPLANEWADKAKQFYLNDSLLSIQYNLHTAEGKWNHMMDQTHIGYTIWQQPPFNKMPGVQYVPPTNPSSSTSTTSVQISNPAPANNPSTINPGNQGHPNNPASTNSSNPELILFADHYTKAVNSDGIRWKIIPGIGRTGSGLTTFPVTASPSSLNAQSPQLIYEFNIKDTGSFTVYAYFSPTLDIYHQGGLKYAISIDNEAPQIIAVNKGDDDTRTWSSWIANNIIIKSTTHQGLKAGKHLLHYWMVSPAVVVQKFVISKEALKPSYLGPE
ncbi:MAG: glycosyl hydrolase 115 family protein [Flavisolibacter sp.]